MQRVHFIGICGTGAYTAAIIAKKFGFQVNGCDKNLNENYNILCKYGIEVFGCHSRDHINSADIVAVSPVLFYSNPEHEEIKFALEQNKLITWQKFVGDYLQRGKNVISVTGTHGKTTTTLLIAKMMVDVGLNPLVTAGARFRKGNTIFDNVSSEYWVIESEEFYNNFHNYCPQYIVFNNLEMDHPDLFSDYKQLLTVYIDFIKKMKNNSILIMNFNSKRVCEVFRIVKEWCDKNEIKVIGYYSERLPKIVPLKMYKFRMNETNCNGADFSVSIEGKDYVFKIPIYGYHNVENALGAICLGMELNIPLSSIKKSLIEFPGVKDRMELVAKINNVDVYNDYAHHPTEIKSVLSTLKLIQPQRKIWAIWEPNLVYRTKVFFEEYINSLNIADKVIVTKLYLGKDIHAKNNSIEVPFLVDRINNKVIDKARCFEDFNDVCRYLNENVHENENIIVLGAGYSGKLCESIVDSLIMRKRR